MKSTKKSKVSRNMIVFNTNNLSNSHENNYLKCKAKNRNYNIPENCNISTSRVNSQKENKCIFNFKKCENQARKLSNPEILIQSCCDSFKYLDKLKKRCSIATSIKQSKAILSKINNLYDVPPQISSSFNDCTKHTKNLNFFKPEIKCRNPQEIKKRRNLIMKKQNQLNCDHSQYQKCSNILKLIEHLKVNQKCNINLEKLKEKRAQVVKRLLENDINKSFDIPKFYLDSSERSFKVDTSTCVKAIHVQNRIRSQKVSRNKYISQRNQGINTDDYSPLSELPDGESYMMFSPIDMKINDPLTPHYPLASINTSSTASKDRVTPVKILFGTLRGVGYMK